ncbi:MAG TPA: CARDB domain-containing protein, partial [Thermoanaerobaculia bacterium]
MFRWTSSAKNADGSPITMILHIVNPSGADVVFYMAYNSGTTTGGANFSYDKTLTGTGMYQYYFVAQTSAGGYTRYPATYNLSGPRSDPPAAADFIGSWLNVRQYAVAGQAVTLEGQVMNVGGLTAGASYAQFVVSSMNTTGAHTDQRAIGGAMYVGALAPNASSPRLTATWVPDQTGVFYVSLVGDWYNGVAESNEANNAYTPWPQVTTVAPIQTAGDHKVGLVFISPPALDSDPVNGTYMGRYRTYLNEVLQQVAAGRPSRVSGSKSVRLAVQLEVRWEHTETCEGCFNFAWYDQFAAECRARGIRWTPLLSTHYMPSFYRTRYAGDALKAVSGAAYDPFAVADQYLKHGPGSAIWQGEAARWTREFVRYMSMRGHLGPNGVIDEILVGNELIFPTATLTSSDNASLSQWSQLYPGTPYPTSWTPTFMTFRGNALGSMLAGLVATVK